MRSARDHSPDRSPHSVLDGAPVLGYVAPTSPGLPLTLDSPGLPAQCDGDTRRVVVPTPRVGGDVRFKFDAASAALRVDASDQA